MMACMFTLHCSGTPTGWRVGQVAVLGFLAREGGKVLVVDVGDAPSCLPAEEFTTPVCP